MFKLWDEKTDPSAVVRRWPSASLLSVPVEENKLLGKALKGSNSCFKGKRKDWC